MSSSPSSHRKRRRVGDTADESHSPSKQPCKTCGHCPPVWSTVLNKAAPFSDEPEAAAARDAIDYCKKITIDDARAGRVDRPVRVYADGIYDMFHSGHARQLMQVKMAFPGSVYLIVGVCSDAMTHAYKGQTVMSENERYEMVRHCRYVDEVLRDAPWSTDWDFINKNKIDFVAHDDIPYGAKDSEDVYKWLKDAGKFLATQRTEGISTTDVIARIIKDYDMYVRRNLKRGYSAKELNVSFMKEKQLKLEEKVDSVKDKASHILDQWEEKSRDLVSSFIGLFNRDGRINHWLKDKRAKLSGRRDGESSSSSEDGFDSSSNRGSATPSPTFR